MSKQISFSRLEHEVLPKFRASLQAAESSEDIKKFFGYAVKELLEHAMETPDQLEHDAIALTPNAPPYYRTSDELRSTERFRSVWGCSDLPQIIGQLAKTAKNHYLHLEKHPEKTNAKIRGELH